MGRENVLQKGIIQVKSVARRGWMRAKTAGRSAGQWLRSSPRRTALLGAGTCALALGATLAVTGLPDWETLDDVRDVLGAKPTLAELKKRVRQNPKDAEGWVELGHAQLEAKNPGGAARSYGRALGLDASLASDRVVEGLMSCFGNPCQQTAAEVISRHKVVQAEPKLDGLVRSKRYVTRYGAINTLERLGRASKANYLALWTTDLGSPDCDVRRNAVERLGTLGHKGAIVNLRAADQRDEAETPWYRFSCLGDSPKEAEQQILAHK